MKELKFRAWGENIKEYMSQSFDGEVEIANVTRILGDLIDQGNWVIEQYIGLKDENGKEIYEGDIIKAEYYDGAQENNRQPAKVVWSDFDLCFVARFKDAREEGGVVYLPEDMPIDAGNMEGVKVIGNIHENLELFGGEE